MAPKTPKRKVLTDREQIAERLKNARIDLELTQMQLAEKAGLGRSTIMHYENAKAAPGAMELLSLAKSLEISPNYILSGKEQFRKKSNDEFSFDPVDQTQTVARLSMLILALPPEVRDSLSGLLMSMVKERIGEKEFKKFIAVIDATMPAIGDMTPDVESLAEKHINEARIEEIEAAVEAVDKGL